jgi:hypothetical protein
MRAWRDTLRASEMTNIMRGQKRRDKWGALLKASWPTDARPGPRRSPTGGSRQDNLGAVRIRAADRQMVEILGAVLSNGLSAAEAACAEALGECLHSADVMLNTLARRRDHGPPVTIMTPQALRLRHEPAADCARCDSLRRAI